MGLFGEILPWLLLVLWKGELAKSQCSQGTVAACVCNLNLTVGSTPPHYSLELCNDAVTSLARLATVNALQLLFSLTFMLTSSGTVQNSLHYCWSQHWLSTETRHGTREKQRQEPFRIADVHLLLVMVQATCSSSSLHCQD